MSLFVLHTLSEGKEGIMDWSPSVCLFILLSVCPFIHCKSSSLGPFCLRVCSIMVIFPLGQHVPSNGCNKWSSNLADAKTQQPVGGCTSFWMNGNCHGLYICNAMVICSSWPHGRAHRHNNCSSWNLVQRSGDPPVWKFDNEPIKKLMRQTLSHSEGFVLTSSQQVDISFHLEIGYMLISLELYVIIIC